MNSSGGSLAWSILSQVVGDHVRNPTPPALLAVDRVVTLVAIASLVLALWRWLALAPRDPFVFAPVRSNNLGEDSLLLAVVVYLMAALLLSIFAGAAGIGTDGALYSLVIGGGAQVAGIGVCLHIAANRFEGGVPQFIRGAGGVGAVSLLTVTLLVAVIAVGLCPVVLRATEKLVLCLAPGFEFTAHPTIEALHESQPSAGVVAILWIGAVALAPVAEEVFFRGILQTLAVNVVRRRGVAIGLTSVAFGLVHYSQPQVIPALVVLAVLIGYAYERTGSLIPPILIHAVFNLKTLVWDAVAGC